MKPVRLTMQAFGPYPERQVIDFRNAVEARLFGIYGPTGSGKSTIFSAMTFALFGEPARTDQSTLSLRSGFADAGVPTEVEFVFDIGERRYVVLRRPDQKRPKKRGDGEIDSSHEAFLFDATGLALDNIKEGQCGKIIAEKKVRDVDAAISKVLGYRLDQFRQIVLLPQGRFEAFLSAKTKERLAILRDLFDVSIYRSLAAKLWADAEAAERHVREEREVCARRLAAEGFESTDALTVGIADAEACHAELLENEKTARVIFETAQAAYREGEKIEAQFKTAEDAQSALAQLQAGKGDMDALADRVAGAERARSLLDAETNVTEAADEVREGEGKLRQAEEVVVGANKKAKSTAEALLIETDRAEETEKLRQHVEELERHEQIVAKAKGAMDAVETAQTAERMASGKLDDAQRRLTDLYSKRSRKSDTLKVTRQTEAGRQDIATRLVTLKSVLAAVETFEKAQNDALTAKTRTDTRASEHEAARSRAEKARAIFDEAERSLSLTQALHLASKLEAGVPCPVCGATEHPAPATGEIEHAGRDQAFRETQAAWQKADEVARRTEQELVAAQSVLTERQDRLTTLGRPEETSAELKEKLRAETQVLEALGPEANIAEAEAEIEQLSKEIAALETERDTLRNGLSDKQRIASSEKARLDEMLTAVPAALREQNVLVAARESASQALMDRRAARTKAEVAATTAREAALGAQKDQQAAEHILSLSRERQRRAVDTFRLRLEQVALSEEDFQALKPAIATIDADRATVDGYHRKLENAKETAKRTAEVIEQQIRPDLVGLGVKQREAGEMLTDATNQRSGAEHRLNHLGKLRDELTEAWHRLDEAEVASGPLRKLAALANGDNPQKLDLETFAIGAMFDHVLESANLRLGPMTADRYRLERDLEEGGRGRRGLGIQVFDSFTGKARPTATLSGGETFIAALALALGLADTVESASGEVRLDTIFIDEGFSSLDTENESGTLEQVLQILNSLVSQNRSVGIISHVPLVQEAIPNGFYVRKHPAGSIVEARGVG